MKKVCTKCGVEQELAEFWTNKHSKDGLQHVCKNCQKQYHKQQHIIYKEKHNRQSKQYHASHKKEQSEWQKKYDFDHKEEKKQYHKQHHIKHKEEINQKSKQWYQKNKIKVMQRNKIRRHTNIKYKMICYLRARLRIARKNNQKSGSAVRDLGCSIEFLKQYIESLFKPEMTWENYGFRGWHIDHIIPLSSFDLTNREEFLKACHYTNLQPLWAKENIQKSNKLCT
jgi:hypothetical protein